MPITPLHLGLLAPINHFFPGKVSNLSFILVNLWLDAYAIALFGFGWDLGELHGPDTHSLTAALAIAGLVFVPVFMYRVIKHLMGYAHQEKLAMAWLSGCYLGAITHILLDAMVHSEMLPFHPLQGNPLYCNAMVPLSAVLVVLTAWFILQLVSGKVVVPGRT